MKEFLSKKAGEIAGVPQRTVQSWTEKGLIIPDISDTTGTGDRRRYSIVNVIELAVIKALSRERLSYKAIRGITEFLQFIKGYHKVNDQVYLHLAINNNDTETAKPSIQFVKPGKLLEIGPDAINFDKVITINLTKIKNEIISKLSSIKITGERV